MVIGMHTLLAKNRKYLAAENDKHNTLVLILPLQKMALP